MSRNERLFVVGVCAIAAGLFILNHPRFKGAWRSLAAQLESTGVEDMLAALVG
jgi:hypothetical protein